MGIGRSDRRALAEWGPLTSDDSGAGYAARDTDTWAMGLHRSAAKGEVRAQPGGWGLLARGSEARARADAWERRGIIQLVNKVLPEEEKRPWLKNVKVHLADDFFAIESFEPTKKPKARKSK